MNFYEGQRVSFHGHRCTVRYIGSVATTKGEWLGVEWDDTSRGKHDGTLGTHTYFTCRSRTGTAGSFIRPNRSSDRVVEFLDAVRDKYSQDSRIEQAKIPRQIYFNGKIAEEVGFDKISKHFASLNALEVVILDGKCIKGPSNVSNLASLHADVHREKVDDIRRTCPNVRHLGLASNLFETFKDALSICEAFPNLTKLDLRFQMLVSKEGGSLSCIETLNELALDSTLLEWTDLITMSCHLPSLTKLSFAHNLLKQIDRQLIINIEELNLSDNKFSSLDDLAPLAAMTTLKKLILRGCPLSHLISEGASTCFLAVLHLDVTDSKFTGAALATLQKSFPNIKSLRCSGLTQGEELELIARTKTLEMLNSSKIATSIRANAEIYYLSKIAEELSLSEESKNAVLKRHPRWSELCAIHDEPVIRNSSPMKKFETSLAESLLNITFRDSRMITGSDKHMDRDTLYHIKLPRTLKTHQLYEHIAEKLSTYPRMIKLTWQPHQAHYGQRKLITERLRVDAGETSVMIDTCKSAIPWARQRALISTSTIDSASYESRSRRADEVEIPLGNHPVWQWLGANVIELEIFSRM